MAGSPKRKIQLRRGDSSQWVSANPVLSQGEPGYDTTTGALKVGDGLNAWTDLAGLGGGTTNEPFIPLSVGVVGADPVVINEAGTYWLSQAAPYIDGAVYAFLAPPETDDNVKVRLMYDSDSRLTRLLPDISLKPCRNNSTSMSGGLMSFEKLSLTIKQIVWSGQF